MVTGIAFWGMLIDSHCKRAISRTCGDDDENAEIREIEALFVDLIEGAKVDRVDRIGKLLVFELSAEDGSRIHESELPLQLE